MIPTTIEWFTPAEQMPDDDTFVLLAADGETDTGYLQDGAWYRDMSMPVEVGAPDFWAHIPAGPEA
jgi:hypothetical protein